MEVTVTEQADSRVKLDVKVPPEELAKTLDGAAAELGKELKVPGFRKGKVPATVVIGRVGREAVLEQALRGSLSEWYAEAVFEAGVVPVGEPDFSFEEMPAEGQALKFAVALAVRPKATLGEYKGLEVGRREPEVPGADIDAELERLREGFGSLEPVERKSRQGDFVVVDFAGTVDGESIKGGEARDHPIEIGAGQMIEGFEEKLIGAGAGEELQFDIDFPEQYAGEEVAGKTAHFEVTIKAVQEKRLPELDDDFASEAAGLDSIEELRAEVEARLSEAHQRTIESEYREAVVDAVVDRASVPVDDELIKARADEMWHSFRHRLAHQGMNPDQYLQISGKTEEEMLGELLPQAEQSLKRESVLEAVADAESIEIGDDELLEDIQRADSRAGEGSEREADPERVKKILKQIKASGRDRSLKQELRLGKAAELLVEAAAPISAGRAEAREKLWTPDQPR